MVLNQLIECRSSDINLVQPLDLALFQASGLAHRGQSIHFLYQLVGRVMPKALHKRVWTSVFHAQEVQLLPPPESARTRS